MGLNDSTLFWVMQCGWEGGGGFNLKFEAQSTGKESWRRRGVVY